VGIEHVLTTRVRWLIAAAAAALAMSSTWTLTAGDLTPGISGLTNQYNPLTNSLDLIPYYIPGYYVPGTLVRGYQNDARLFLLVALAASLAQVVRARGQLVERIAIGALLASLALALSARNGGIVLLLGLALGLVGGDAWRALRACLLVPSPATG
jgi:hypothetical protein